MTMIMDVVDAAFAAHTDDDVVADDDDGDGNV